MANKYGKTSIVFFVVFVILFLSIAAIMAFLFQKERDLRKATEVQNILLQEQKAEAALDLEEAKKTIFILESRKKEIEEKIEGLLDDLDLEKGLRRELKTESIALAKRAETLVKRKNELRDELVALLEKISFIEDQLAEEKALRQQAEEEIENLKIQSADQVFRSDAGDDVALEKIVVSSEKDSGSDLQGQEGKVLRINIDNNFVIIDRGYSHLIKEGARVTIFRDTEILGQGTVSSIQQSMSVVDLISPLSARDIAINDKVVVQE